MQKATNIRYRLLIVLVNLGEYSAAKQDATKNKRYQQANTDRDLRALNRVINTYAENARNT